MSRSWLALGLSALVALIGPAPLRAGEGPSARIQLVRYQHRRPRGGFVMPIPNIRGHEEALKKAEAHFNELKVNIAAINNGITPDAGRTEKLNKALMGVAVGKTKPSPDAVARLAADLNAALAQRKNLAYNSPNTLALDLRVVINHDPAQPDRTDKAITNAKAILRLAGVPETSVTTILADLKEVRHRVPQPAAGAPGATPAAR